MTMIDFATLAKQTLLANVYDADDWLEWRYCYEGGRLFRDTYLEKYSDREENDEFVRRRKLTPIPTYARREINRVKNALTQRFPDISRRGGSERWRDAIVGNERGVDRRGSSMNNYLANRIVADLLVMGRVGILVDAPQVVGRSMADVPENFSPYLVTYKVEFIPLLVPAPAESPSDWLAVLLEDLDVDIDPRTGVQTDKKSFRYYWLDPDRGNLLSIQRMDENGIVIGPTIETGLDAVPFVVADIGGSLIKDVCSHQITLLNMISTDSNYAIDSNYPFMVRQRSNVAQDYLVGEDNQATTGVKKGLFYDMGLEAPKFISPPTEPMKASLELRRELKAEVRELVTGAIEDLGDGSLEAGLAFIGSCLQVSESRLWDHWGAYESSDPEQRESVTISYPDSWSLKTDMERLEEAEKYVDLMNKLPGQKGKKEASKSAYDKLYRGKLASDALDEIKAEVDAAPYTTSDAKIIIEAKKEGLVGPETGALALGFNADEWKAAEEAQVRRAKAIVEAQADAAGMMPGAARGNPDGSANPNSNKLAREGEKIGAKAIGRPGERGETDDPEAEDPETEEPETEEEEDD